MGEFKPTHIVKCRGSWYEREVEKVCQDGCTSGWHIIRDAGGAMASIHNDELSPIPRRMGVYAKQCDISTFLRYGHSCYALISADAGGLGDDWVRVGEIEVQP